LIANTILFLVYVTVSSLGLYRLKLSAALFDINFITGFVLYGIGFLIWLVILKLNPLSLAFPIAAGALIVATQVIGVFLLSERIGPLNITGIALIIAGIALVYTR
jgi:multidrug transporter EmrE-like cation transporter